MHAVLVSLLTAAPVVVVHFGTAVEPGATRDLRVLAPLFCTAPDGGFSSSDCISGRPTATKVATLDGSVISTSGIKQVQLRAFVCDGDSGGNDLCPAAPMWTLPPRKAPKSPKSKAPSDEPDFEPRDPRSFLGEICVWPASALTKLKLTAGAKDQPLPPELVAKPLRAPVTKSPNPPSQPLRGDAWTLELRDGGKLDLLVTGDAVAQRSPGAKTFQWSFGRESWSLELAGAFALEGVAAPFLVVVAQNPPGFNASIVELSDAPGARGGWGEPDF